MKILKRLGLLCGLILMGLSSGMAQEFNYVMDVYNFRDVDGTPYLEAHFGAYASSLNYQKLPNGNFQDTIAISFSLERMDVEAETIEREFLLVTPEIQDTAWEKLNFFVTDVYRIPVDYGKYKFTGNLVDRQHPERPNNRFESEIIVEGDSKGFAFSDIQFLSSISRTKEATPYSKHGFDIVPLNNNNSFIDQDSMLVYLELYHTDQILEGKYFLATNITQANSDKKMPRYQKSVRKEARAIDVHTTAFDIANLPSNTYYLNLELYNLKNEVVAKESVKFWVVNSRLSTDMNANPNAFAEVFGLSEEELDYYIPSLRYISRPTERDFAKALKTEDEKQAYFYSFWEKRKDPDSRTPAKVWNDWKDKVQYMNDNYGNKWKEGWETDRGRVYAQYGAPSDIERFPVEGTNVPHEIWRYDRLGNQSQVIFVFWYPDLATGDYVLLHSNKFGERQTPNWEAKLNMRTTNNANIDQTQQDDWNYFRKNQGTRDNNR